MTESQKATALRNAIIEATAAASGFNVIIFDYNDRVISVKVLNRYDRELGEVTFRQGRVEFSWSCVSLSNNGPEGLDEMVSALQAMKAISRVSV